MKVLNIDNSDVVVVPQNSIFQMDKDGIELPMQCVLCSMQEVSCHLNFCQEGFEIPNILLNSM